MRKSMSGFLSSYNTNTVCVLSPNKDQELLLMVCKIWKTSLWEKKRNNFITRYLKLDIRTNKWNEIMFKPQGGTTIKTLNDNFLGRQRTFVKTLKLTSVDVSNEKEREYVLWFTNYSLLPNFKQAQLLYQVFVEIGTQKFVHMKKKRIQGL